MDDPEWVNWAHAKTEKVLKELPELGLLNDRLLSLGGDWVALQPEPDLEMLLEKGQLFKGKVVMKPMTACKCHRNCAKIWGDNLKTYRIATGWALSDDGIWRQHTWLMKNAFIVETTSVRILYYGVVLDVIAANSFWLEHI
ncbi:MAG: hypothetical protein ACFCUE_15065 [Candidatus Bathyarchaeia archaeon]